MGNKLINTRYFFYLPIHLLKEISCLWRTTTYFELLIIRILSKFKNYMKLWNYNNVISTVPMSGWHFFIAQMCIRIHYFLCVCMWGSDALISTQNEEFNGLVWKIPNRQCTFNHPFCFLIPFHLLPNLSHARFL